MPFMLAMPLFLAILFFCGVHGVPCSFESATTDCVDDASCCGYSSLGLPTAFCCTTNTKCCLGMNVSLCCAALFGCPSDPLSTTCNPCPVTNVQIKDPLPHDSGASVVLGARAGAACGGSGSVIVPNNCILANELTTLEIPMTSVAQWNTPDVLLRATTFQDDKVFGPETSAQIGVPAQVVVTPSKVTLKFQGSSNICTLPAEQGGFPGSLSLSAYQAGMLIAVADPVSATRTVAVDVTYNCPTGPVVQAHMAMYTRTGYDYLRPVSLTADSPNAPSCLPRRTCVMNVSSHALGNNLSTINQEFTSCGSETTPPTPLSPTAASAPPSAAPTSSPTSSTAPTVTGTSSPTTLQPTTTPTLAPTTMISVAPTATTSVAPTPPNPSSVPSVAPSRAPSIAPTSTVPSKSNAPSKIPTNKQPTTASQATTPTEDSGMSSTVIGIVAGIAACVLLLALCLCYRTRNRRRKRPKGQAYRNLGYYEPPTINVG